MRDTFRIKIANEVRDMDFWMGSRKIDLGLQGILASIVNGVVDTSGKLRVSKEVQCEGILEGVASDAVVRIQPSLAGRRVPVVRRRLDSHIGR